MAEHQYATRIPRILIFQDIVSLLKPELTLLAVLMALGGAVLAGAGAPSSRILLVVFTGTFLVGGGSGALNQFLERSQDALMARTRHRPLPAGRVAPMVALVTGLTACSLGIVVLAVFANTLAAILALLTALLYVGIYTPLKRHTPFATIIGGIPGALPPVIGWAAVRQDLSPPSWALFSILFFWQMPHFLSLAWLYKEEYRSAGFRMLTVLDASGRVTRRQMMIYTVALLPAAVMPTMVGSLGVIYFGGAVVATLWFLWEVSGFARAMTKPAARRVFMSSLVYLPVLVFFMFADLYL